MFILNSIKKTIHLLKLRCKEIAHHIFRHSKLKTKLPKKVMYYSVPSFIVAVFCFSILIPTAIYASANTETPITIEGSSCYQTYLKSPTELDFDCGTSCDQNGTQAYGVYINKSFICAIDNYIDADFLLNSLIFMGNNKLSVNNSAYSEEICTVKGLYNPTDIISYDDFKNLLLSEQGQTISYTVKSSGTLSSICTLFSVDEKSLKETNVADLNCLKPGDTLNIKLTKPVLSLCTEKTVTYNKPIAYKTIYKKDKTLAEGTTVCVVKGQKGSRRITDKVSYVNNQEVSRTNISKKVIRKAVTRVLKVGTLTKGVATGDFMWPVPSTQCVTSGFGARWGTTHKGLDISSGNCYGQNIVAADGGVVTCASDTNDGYGIHIIIDHGNGYQTLYGHASKACVSVGDKVSKGDVIAKIGSTGDSTGPHCHFEIIKNSVHKDPAKYF